jgi:hypothetical protein
VRHIPVTVISLLVLASPGAAHAQWLELYGSAGPTVTDPGYSLAAGAGLSPASRVTFVFGIDRTYLSSQIRTDDRGGASGFRGGTLWLGTAEVQVAPLGRSRLGPFGLVGIAAGVSHPNVSEHFPDRVIHDVRAMILGGGLLVPLSTQMNVIVDARMFVGAEGPEGIVAVAPIRAGIAWRF